MIKSEFQYRNFIFKKKKIKKKTFIFLKKTIFYLFEKKIEKIIYHFLFFSFRDMKFFQI